MGAGLLDKNTGVRAVMPKYWIHGSYLDTSYTSDALHVLKKRECSGIADTKACVVMKALMSRTTLPLIGVRITAFL